MRKPLLILALALGALAFAAAGCGGSEDEGATPAEAAAEIDEIKTLLDRGVDQYRDGDADAADTTVGDAYLEHFEEVEHPLEERDHDLMEDLEHKISTEIREAIKDGKPVPEVETLVQETKAGLDRAKQLLEEGS